MAITKTIDIGLIAVGSIISVPTGKVTNGGTSTLTGVKVVVDVPPGLVYDSSTLPIGSYNVGLNTWENITILPGADNGIEGEIRFEVTDDSNPIFKITFTATSDLACETCLNDNVICMVTTGLTCDQFGICDPILASLPTAYSTSVFGTNCAGEKAAVKPVVIKNVTTYSDQATNLTITLDEPKILHIEPTANITVTLTPGATFCSVKDIDIKHIGTGANRNFNIRILNSAGTNIVDLDTYFEFNNSGTSTNNTRGYNLTAYNFYYNGNDLFVK